MRLTLTNEFHNTQATIVAGRPWTHRRIAAIRRQLCVNDCTCGDALGTRGPQPKGYWEELEAAEAVCWQ